MEATNSYSAGKQDPFNRIDVIYCKNDPLLHPIVVKYDQGFKLQFESSGQTLESIEVFNTLPLTLSYRGRKFCSPEISPTYTTVVNSFGPTVAGDFEREEGDSGRLLYKLSYPGMTLYFVIPPELEGLCQGEDEVLPPECTEALLCKLVIYACLERSRVRAEKVVPPTIKAFVGQGICIEGFTIKFGSSPQDVLAEIGSPDSIYCKTDDHMRLHNVKSQGEATDYFYNYFSLGFDILFDGVTHAAKKFVFHTNFPSHHVFNCYIKCNFSISIPPEYLPNAPRKVIRKKEEPKQQPPAAAPQSGQHVEIDFDEGSDEEDPVPKQQGQQKPESKSNFMITSNTTWEEIEAYLGKKGRPFILNSPAGPTKIFGYPGLAVEVLQNGYLGSVYLFQYDSE